MNHSFDVDIATRYGVYEAILIENIRFWILKNKANNKHFHKGKYWTYNSAKAYAELFPYWSRQQVERIIGKLKEAGVLEVDHFSHNTYDRTNWYTLNEEMLSSNSRNGSIESDESSYTYINADVNKKEEQKKQPTVDLPVWLPKETWDAFVEMRKSMKKPLTDYAIKLMFVKLSKLRDAGHNVGQLIDKSITNGWLDVYEPKGGSTPGVIQMTAAERLKRMAG